MTSKREERRQRSEAERRRREQLRRQKALRSRLLIVAGLLGVIALSALALGRRDDGGGRVWSPEHGHWHER
ncbi:MAG TPA: hypothetical protein VF178_11960 [Gemmatimonadaceae bacterium]